MEDVSDRKAQAGTLITSSSGTSPAAVVVRIHRERVRVSIMAKALDRCCYRSVYKV